MRISALLVTALAMLGAACDSGPGNRPQAPSDGGGQDHPRSTRDVGGTPSGSGGKAGSASSGADDASDTGGVPDGARNSDSGSIDAAGNVETRIITSADAEDAIAGADADADQDTGPDQASSLDAAAEVETPGGGGTSMTDGGDADVLSGSGGMSGDATTADALADATAADATAADALADAPSDLASSESGGGHPISSDGDGDRTIGPVYVADPLTSRQLGVPSGLLFNFVMTGTQSAIYRGINGNYSRNVSVYIPAQYDPARPAALLVTQDALGTGILPIVLDNLIAAKRLPVIVVLFVANGGGDSVASERGLEYDTVSGLYAEFINAEVLPRAVMEARTNVNIDLKITSDPEGRATMGGSSGGAAAFAMAWWHPELFRRVVAFSGTFVNQVPNGSPFPHGGWVYHDVDPYDPAAPSGLIVQHCQKASGDTGSSNPGPCDTPLSQPACVAVAGCAWNATVNKPLRVWIESGDRDLGAGGAPATYRNYDLANQRMAAALKRRGYHYHYDHALGAGHVDGNVIRQTVPESLLWLWRGYPIE